LGISAFAVHDFIPGSDPRGDFFYAAFGRFLHEFSKAEQTLHLYLWEISGIQTAVLRALVTEQRLSTVKDAISRLFESRSEQPPEIDVLP
jgi:hypothetical protein